jgi:membrane associated rhomboid family serine protease
MSDPFPPSPASENTPHSQARIDPAPPFLHSVAVPYNPVGDFVGRMYAATPRVYVTPIIIGINILVFLIMALKGAEGFDSADVPKMIQWGADYGPLTTNGQSWRLLSSMFVHFGVIHIALNMVVLYQLGPLTERLFGNFCFLVIYLLSGLCGSLLSAAMHPVIVAGGASGAIFGICGALIGFLAIQRSVIPRPLLKSLMNSMIFFVVVNVAIGSSVKMIDMSAHIGGLLSGVVLGAILSRRLDRGAGIWRAVAVLFLAGVPIVWAGTHLPFVADMDAEVRKMHAAIDDANTAFNSAADDWNKTRGSDEKANDRFATILDTQVLPPIRELCTHLQNLKGVSEENSNRDMQKLAVDYTANEQKRFEKLLLGLKNPKILDASVKESNQIEKDSDRISKELLKLE